MLNPFFLNGSTGEQGLLQSLNNEALMMYGVECYYMPRQYITEKTVIREVIESEFNNAYPLEAYVDNYDGYGGQGTILSKFGIEDRDDLTLIISKERFENYITPLIASLSNSELSTRPKEGDLIFFPLGERLFEIKFVEHENPFYQLKDRYVYELKCSLFRYEDEVIDTGVDEVDETIQQLGYIQTLTMVGTARTATATAGYCASGAVQSVTINDMGSGYTSQPQIGFSSAPAGGVTAVGVASVTGLYGECSVDGVGGKVAAINLINAGCGYTVAPWVTIYEGGGMGAGATAGITTSGAVQFITVTDGGAGYSTAPSVTFTGSSDIDAIGISTISSAGIVTAVYVVNSGAGYTQAPTVTLAAPRASGAGLGTGYYIFNEIVTGQTSGTTARVKEWDNDTSKLEISIIDGHFERGEEVIGADSGARHVIFTVETTAEPESDLVDGFADNDIIEEEADGILDFSESNPFGDP